MQMRVIMKVLHVRFSFRTRDIWSSKLNPANDDPTVKKQNKKNTKAELFQSLRQGYFLWDPGDGVNINHMKQLVLPRGGLLFPINRFQEFQSCLGEQ